MTDVDSGKAVEVAEDVVRVAGSHVVDLGGRLVHLQVTPGEGAPVVLLGGCAVPSYAFGRVVDRLDGHWLIGLDRPGLVDTPWPGHLPTLAEEVGTLAALVQALGAPPVIVAHSMAGPHVEALVREHPGSVRGLVLVDASVEVDAEPPPALWDRAWLVASDVTLSGARVPPIAAAAAFAARIAVWSQSRRLHLTHAQPPRAGRLFRRPDSLANVVAEQAAYGAQLADLQDLLETTTWPATPSIVLTAGDQSTWVTKQRVLAERLGARHVVVDDSLHLMMVDRPDVIADAVVALLR